MGFQFDLSPRRIVVPVAEIDLHPKPNTLRAAFSWSKNKSAHRCFHNLHVNYPWKCSSEIVWSNRFNSSISFDSFPTIRISVTIAVIRISSIPESSSTTGLQRLHQYILIWLLFEENERRVPQFSLHTYTYQPPPPPVHFYRRRVSCPPVLWRHLHGRASVRFGPALLSELKSKQLSCPVMIMLGSNLDFSFAL